MSWVGFDILLSRYPQLKGDIEKLQTYVKQMKLKVGDVLDLLHASAWTNIPHPRLREILERGVKIGIFQKVYRLKCSIKEGIVHEQESPFSFPLEFFCDLCGESHIFTEDDVMEGYRLKFIFSNDDLAQIRNTMPLLCYYAKRISKEFRNKQPFRNKMFLIILHFLKDLLIFLEACEKLGLEPGETHLFYKPYLYPHRDLICSYLKSRGYHVYPLEKLEDVLEKFNQLDLTKDIVVIEDGGYIVPLLHKRFLNLCRRTIGAVEQTTKGIRNDERILNIMIPVLSVAEADIKSRIEPSHIADAVIQNIKDLLSHEKIRGQKIALMGYGTIGREIAEKLKNMGAHVVIYDPRSEKRIEAKEKGYETVLEPYNAVKDVFLVIGCSGEKSIGRTEILSMKHNTYLVSASSDQREIGLLELESLSSHKETLKNPDGKIIGTCYTIRGKNIKINLLADGYPINFWYSESMPNQVSDLILSLILLSTLELIVNREQYAKGIQSINEVADKYEVAKIYEEHYYS